MQLFTYDISLMTDTEYSRWYAAMSAERRKKCDAYRNESDKKLCAAADMLIKKAFSEMFGVKAEELLLEYDENGKPYARGRSEYFSVSHSGTVAAVAADRKPVGVDIEKIRQVKVRTLDFFCSVHEKAYVFGKEGFEYDSDYAMSAEELIRFFEIWTFKEAYVKCTGTGITVDLKEIPFFTSEKKTIIKNGYVLTVLSI